MNKIILILLIFLNRPVDIWSLGTLAYEVLTSKPLFPGESDLDQLYLIINSLGNCYLVYKYYVTRVKIH